MEVLGRVVSFSDLCTCIVKDLYVRWDSHPTHKTAHICNIARPTNQPVKEPRLFYIRMAFFMRFTCQKKDDDDAGTMRNSSAFGLRILWQLLLFPAAVPCKFIHVCNTLCQWEQGWLCIWSCFIKVYLLNISPGTWHHTYLFCCTVHHLYISVFSHMHWCDIQIFLHLCSCSQ